MYKVQQSANIEAERGRCRPRHGCVWQLLRALRGNGRLARSTVVHLPQSQDDSPVVGVDSRSSYKDRPHLKGAPYTLAGAKHEQAAHAFVSLETNSSLQSRPLILRTNVDVGAIGQ